MEIKIREEGGFAIIELSGEVDLSCSPEARKEILACLKANKNLLIDLSAVTYIDSSGVASLVEGYQTARGQNQKFGLVGVSKAVLNVLQLARLDKVFPIYDNAAACISANN